MPRTRLFHLRIMTLNHFKRSYAFIFYGVISFILLTHCQPSSKKNVNDGVVNLLPLDTLYLDIPDGFGSGFTTMANDSLYFFDQVSGRVYSFDTNGRYGSKKLGVGNGPKEVTGIDAYLYADGLHIIMHGWTVFIFDKNWHRINQFKINFDVKQNITTLERNPKPEYHGIYEYELTKTLNAAFDQNKFFIDRTEKGYYTYVKAFPDQKKTLRIYTLGTDSEDLEELFQVKKRMQVYENFDFREDWDLPQTRFKVLGYVNDHYYADGLPDYDNNRVGIYRFKL